MAEIQQGLEKERCVSISETFDETFNDGKSTAEELSERLMKEIELLEKKIRKARRMVKETKLDYDYDKRTLLGKGSKALVFKGRFGIRRAAVKRFLPRYRKFADHEAKLMLEIETIYPYYCHKNIVQLLFAEYDRRHIVFEFCDANLQDFIEDKGEMRSRLKTPTKDIMHQAMRGLDFLHRLDIVHRNLKPQNILILLTDINRDEVVVKLCDFGLSIKLDIGTSSFSSDFGHSSATNCWTAPEILKGTNGTKAVDIFSMGCVIYYVLTNGHHLFGDPFNLQKNILSHEYDMSKLKKSDLVRPFERIVALQLIEDMIADDPSKRPATGDIFKHPLWWHEEKTFGFFEKLSFRVGWSSTSPDALNMLERNARNIIRGDWKRHLDRNIKKNLNLHDDYNGKSVGDLLRFIRKARFRSINIAENLFGLKEYTSFFLIRFPKLLSHTYHVKDLFLKENDESFEFYYPTEYVFTKPYARFEKVRVAMTALKKKKRRPSTTSVNCCLKKSK